jgi:AraC-like DNA-binding protein
MRIDVPHDIARDDGGRPGLRRHVLRCGEQLDLTTKHDDALHLVRASGHGSGVQLPRGWISLWMPLSGCLRLACPDATWKLARGRMQLWCDTGLAAYSDGQAWWLALAGSEATWVGAMRSSGTAARHGLFPRQGPCPLMARRLLVRIARMRIGMPAELVEVLCACLLDDQRELQDRLRHCSGRSAHWRRQTLMRLLRVRHLIENCEGRFDLACMARVANYSPSYLIRMHRDVFDETPAEYAARLRLDRVWSLVSETHMPIREIADAFGFESQSTFCRAFRNAYGTTTGAVRERHAERLAMDAASAACAA